MRDLLKIVADKCNSFKNLIMDRGKMKKVLSELHRVDLLHTGAEPAHQNKL